MAVCTTPDGTSSAVPAGGQRAHHFLADTGEMVLRVRSIGEEARIVRIRSPKCTVGSSLGCTLRLRGAGLGRSQCWILRGKSVTVIRRLHGRATLNGAQFDESLLKVGDRLQLGEVDLEVVECNQNAPAPVSAFAPPQADFAQLVELQGKLDEALAQVDRLHEESHQAFQSSIVAAERAEQMRDAVALANEELEELHSALAAAEQNLAARTAERDELERRLESETGAGREQIERVEQARAQVDAAIAERERLVAELAAIKAALTEEQQQRAAERHAFEQRFAQQQSELESLRQTLIEEQSRAAATAMAGRESDEARAEWEARIQELEHAVSAKNDEVKSLQILISTQGDSEQRLKELSAEYAAKCEQAERAQAELAESVREVDRLKQGLAEAAAVIASEQEKWLKEQAELQESVARQAAEMESLREKYAAAQSCAMTMDLSQIQESDEAGKEELNARIEALERQVAAKCEEVQSLQATLEQQAGVQHELERLTTEHEATCRELAEAHSRIAAADAASCSAKRDLEERTNALNRLQTALNDRQAALEQAQQRLADQSERIATEADQLAAARQQREELESRRLQMEQLAQELQAKSAAIDAKQAEVEELQQQLLDQRIALANHSGEITQWREELENRQREMELRVQELEAREEQLQQHEQALAREAADLGSREPVSESATHRGEQHESEAASDEQPSWASDSYAASTLEGVAPAEALAENPHESGEVDSVLSRLVQAGLWRGDEPPGEAAEQAPREDSEPSMQAQWHAEQEPEPIGQTVCTTAESVRRFSSPPADGPADEESIESYMARLMQRVRGDSSSASGASTPLPPRATAPPPLPEPEAVTPAVAESIDTEEKSTVDEVAELAPRRAAPELGASLSAMRDLANSAARSAIDQHVRKHTGKQAASRLVGAVLTLGASSVLGYFAWLDKSTTAASGAIVGGGLGVYWAMAALRRVFKLMRLNRAKGE